MKILFLQKRILFPANTGGKIRTLNVLRYLAQWREVTYLCNTQETDSAEDLQSMREIGVRLETLPWREVPRSSWRFYRDLAYNLFSKYPFTASKDFDPALRARAEQLLAEESYDLVICDFVQMARNAVDLPGVKLLFQHNVEAQIFHRHATSGRGFLRRKFMGYQWRKMRRFEAEAGHRFDAVIAVSPEDQQTFKNDYDWRHVHTIHTSVDLEYFQPDSGAEREGHVVFLGSMDWLPNQDAAHHFVTNVWPQIRARHPEAKFQVVGRNPTADVRQLAETAGVEIVGTVPDVRPYLANAAVVVVPLLVGGGTRIKIFEAMAMRKAIVSTTLGAEGLGAAHNEQLLLADTAGEFASAVSWLLDEERERERLGAAAREFVEPYSAEAVARQFERICIDTVKPRSMEQVAG